MNGDDRVLMATGSVAALLGVGAGVAEILAGTVSWAGNKNDPTTLGWVTIALALLTGAATMLACRSHRPGSQFAAATALLASGLVGLTTAGLAWVPAAVGSLAACVLVVRRPRGEVTWSAVIRANWAPALVGVLALVYLTFGVIAGGGTGLLGIAAAGMACAALAVRRRSRAAATIGLVVAAVPFALTTAWTVVTPLTALLILAIGLPYVLDRSHTIEPRRGTS